MILFNISNIISSINWRSLDLAKFVILQQKIKLNKICLKGKFSLVLDCEWLFWLIFS